MMWHFLIKLRWLGLAVMLAVTGCTSVAPWERGTLAKPQMSLDPTPLQSGLRHHQYSSREGTVSIDASGGGGGCGCY